MPKEGFPDGILFEVEGDSLSADWLELCLVLLDDGVCLRVRRGEVHLEDGLVLGSQRQLRPFFRLLLGTDLETSLALINFLSWLLLHKWSRMLHQRDKSTPRRWFLERLEPTENFLSVVHEIWLEAVFSSGQILRLIGQEVIGWVHYGQGFHHVDIHDMVLVFKNFCKLCWDRCKRH